MLDRPVPRLEHALDARLTLDELKVTRERHRSPLILQCIEDWLAEQGKRPADSDLAEMDALWNRAKAEDKAG